MAERSRIFDDMAGVAGGAFSALTGIGEELGALIRARVDEALSRLSLVRRDEFEAVSELAANAREKQEDAEARLAALEARIAALETAPTRAATDQHGLDGAPGGPPPRQEGGFSEMPPPAGN
ncbi:accessory factor UbiK family protein [Acetobacteraceae bacterium KSS8]|uniref:Accessory factor UbiK family protein n=1 Tax=Endosaccharibacter trunci TaxID=2812733 RepID=A0ABT1W9I7_9PROT|nr:accessory factor UbiK family protein [Acetobacteraceae bacterium KSS8]